MNQRQRARKPLSRMAKRHLRRRKYRFECFLRTEAPSLCARLVFPFSEAFANWTCEIERISE